MKVLICGSRDWSNRDAISREIKKLPLDTLIIHGACAGADQMAGEIAHRFGLQVKEFPADWVKHGKAAGPIRNLQMLDQKPDLVIAFHENLNTSKGTKHTVSEAKKRGIEVRVIEQA